jgi:hypothetical protein
MIKGKAILKVAPGLSKQPKGQGIFLIMLVMMASLGGVFAGYYIDTSLIHKPLNVFGICEPPATLGNVGGVYAGVGGHVECYTTSITTEEVNGNPQSVAVRVPAGSYEYLNGSVAP